MTKATQIKYLAYSSRLAFVCKAGLSLLICTILALLARDAKNAFAVYFLLFPILGIITDSILYLRRDKIFAADINEEDVPEIYGLNAEELRTYAKKIPLVRLFRVIPAMLLFPLGLYSIPSSFPVIFLVSVLMGYYPAALADVFFARKLGIKLPSTYKLIFQGSFSSLSNHNSFKNSSSIIDMNQCFTEQSGVLGFRKPIYESLNTMVTPISPPSIPSCFSTHH